MIDIDEDDHRVLVAAAEVRRAQQAYRDLDRLPNAERGENWSDVWGKACDDVLASRDDLIRAALGWPPGEPLD